MKAAEILSFLLDKIMVQRSIYILHNYWLFHS